MLEPTSDVWTVIDEISFTSNDKITAISGWFTNHNPSAVQYNFQKKI